MVTLPDMTPPEELNFKFAVSYAALAWLYAALPVFSATTILLFCVKFTPASLLAAAKAALAVL